MTVIDGRTWLEYLGPQACWELLASTPVGRLAVIEDSAPAIYPVNHVVDDESIVFRTDSGSKLRALLRIPLVCFEVDGVDAAESTGWSVMVKGRAEELHRPDDLHRVAQLPLEIWAAGAKAHWIRIVPEQVAGRRIWARKTSAGSGDVPGVGPGCDRGERHPLAGRAGAPDARPARPALPARDAAGPPAARVVLPVARDPAGVPRAGLRAGPQPLQRGATPTAGDDPLLPGPGRGRADGSPRLLLPGDEL